MQRLSDIMTTNRTGEKGKPHSQHVEHTSTTTPATPVAKPESAQPDLTTSGQAGQPAATSNPADIEVARPLPAAFEHEGKIDAETAKYLDSSVIIDDETNRQIKRMVRRVGRSLDTHLRFRRPVSCVLRARSLCPYSLSEF